ncbi:MAG: peptidoglycan-binding protein [Patescibacteria group bacterium]|nr:peptidoglycan-binding protein [Patescibacteria group bacterium]MDE2172454.1 peptidoglycan-binding protein [Patescibacteria group bacterium]
MNKTIIACIAALVLVGSPTMSFADQPTQTPAPSQTPSSTPSQTPAITPVSAPSVTASASSASIGTSVQAPSSSASGSSATAPTVPSTSSSGSTAGTPATAPATSGSSSTAGSSGSGTPNTSGSSSTAGSSGSGTPNTSGSSSTAGSATPTPTPATNGGSSNNAGSVTNTSSSGSYIGGSVLLSSAATGLESSTTPNAACPLLRVQVMEHGWANDPVQVSKLQAFLKNYEKFDVDVNGVYDDKTVAAVKAFQTKYMSTIMGPWGATQPSGITYITTVKEINNLACQIPLSLTTAELGIIQNYQNTLALAASASSTSASSSAQMTMTTGNATDSTALAVLSPEPNSANTAAVGNVSFLRRFWDFILSLFR